MMAFTGCKKDDHQGSTSAKGNLHSKDGQCFDPIVHGGWYNGISTGDSTHYVEIKVDVTRTGSYRITTDKRNGVSFAGSGTFTSTGPNLVRLDATGSFINSGVTNFPISFDTTVCEFAITAQDSTILTIADNTWQFTAEGHVYRGTCYATLYQIPQSDVSNFDFTGVGLSGSPDTTLSMGISLSSNGLGTISYLTSTPGTGLYFTIGSGANMKYIYRADQHSVPAVIDIHPRIKTTIPDPYETVIIGSFNGTVRDTAQNIIPITNSVFKIVM
jgi:hypothetical protein